MNKPTRGEMQTRIRELEAVLQEKDGEIERLKHTIAAMEEQEANMVAHFRVGRTG